MKRFGSVSMGVAQGSVSLFSAFENGGEMWTGEGPRNSQHQVRFDEVFLSAPFVYVSLGMWDIDQNTNQRADIRAEEITGEGFRIVFRTWGDTRVARVRADWIAIGAVTHEGDWEL